MQTTEKPFISIIFDREPLQQIVWDRVALVGESAHPVTPHAGRRCAEPFACIVAYGAAWILRLCSLRSHQLIASDQMMIRLLASRRVHGHSCSQSHLDARSLESASKNAMLAGALANTSFACCSLFLLAEQGKGCLCSTNMSIADAHSLGQAIAENGDLQTALRAYQQDRLERTTKEVPAKLDSCLYSSGIGQTRACVPCVGPCTPHARVQSTSRHADSRACVSVVMAECCQLFECAHSQHRLLKRHFAEI